MTTNVITAYKGFDHRLQCRDMQYAIGETFTYNGDVVPCRTGLHACLHPLDVLQYYPPSRGRFAVVEAEDYESADSVHDTKLAARKLHIERELTPLELVAAAINYVATRTTLRAKPNSGDKHAVSRADGTRVTTTGVSSVSVSTHRSSVASADGNKSVAAATRRYSLAAATKHYAIAAATGHRSVARAYAPCSVAAVTGDYSVVRTAGAYSISASTGGYGIVAAAYPHSIAASTGTGSLTINESAYGVAVATGTASAVRSLYAHGVALAAGGNSSASAEDADSVAIALGRGSRARAEEGGFIVCGYRNSAGHLLHLRVAKVGENGTKPGVWHTLDEHGEFVEGG